MKCRKCNAEWTPGKASITLTNCPFCGASLTVEAKPKEVTLGSALKQLIDDFGISILQNHQKCVAILRDTAPQLRNEQKVLEVAFNFGISSYFINCPAEDRKKNVNRAMQAIEFLNNESKELVITAFVKALNWDEIDLGNLFGTTSKDEVRTNQLTDNKNADKLHQGVTPVNNNDEDEDFESCKGKAESGNAESQYRLGCIYLKGEGVAKNNSQAFKWFKAAAEQEHAKAQYELGNCYMNWTGTSKDVTLARYWYERAAINGNLDAKKKIDELRYKSYSQKPWENSYSYEKQYSGMIQNPGHVPGYITRACGAETEAYFKKEKTKRTFNQQSIRRNENYFNQHGFTQYEQPRQRNTTLKQTGNTTPVSQLLTITNPLGNAKVVIVYVKKGDKIKVGDVIAELEAFGMINEILSPANGIVDNVLVSKGMLLKQGNVIVAIRPI